MKRFFYMLMDAAPAAAGGAGNPAPAAPAPNEMESLKTQNAALMQRLEALEKSLPKPQEDQDLATKAKNIRETEDKKNADTKVLETALRFTMQAKEFAKTNESILPKSIAGIIEQADKENFANVIEKDQAIKVGIIQEFFAQQSNLDLLTPGLKSKLDDFLKLTKNVKQERSQQLFDDVFEPTFEMLKRIKKAELLSKGLAEPTNSEEAYKNKLMEQAKKQYLRGV